MTEAGLDPHTTDQITANYLAQCQAMIGADVATLASLLTPEFTLTHMTGYLQSREEWLSDIRTGRMIYHAIHNVDISGHVAGADAAILTARSRTRATIWGAEGTWPLQLRIRFLRTGGGWLAADTVASTW